MLSARGFHDETTHTPQSIRTGTHTLDWDNKPFPFKVYTELPALPLPREFDPLATDTLAALDPERAAPTRRLDLDGLAALLYFSAGVTKKKTFYGGGEMLFRAAASTGGLYQTEIYVAAGEVDGLEPGLYHFGPGDFALRRLRNVDVRAALAEAAADESLARRAAVIVLSAIYWRNTWKYQARGFRHLFWDSGTMLANLIATGNALGAAPRVITGFVDDAVNHLLGLDVEHESALELVAVGSEGEPAPSVGALPAIDDPTLPLSSESVDYPELRAMLTASRLETPEAVRAWRASARPAPRRPQGALTPLPQPRHEAGRGLGETIQRRGSTRQFSHAPITADELSTVLWYATRPVDGDAAGGLVDLYLVLNAVDGLPGGAVRYWPEPHALEALSEGQYRSRSGYLCLEQALGADAAAVIYFMAPLDGVLAAYGDRGYRLVNLEAGLAGGRAYLVAYALGFGASGLTFYDREVVKFFSPSASGEDAIFVTALGRSVGTRGVEASGLQITSRPGDS
ncbi:MAG TPA: SagB/ThcOx family dehydrogenase [Candidatus Acidoferrum sp.]|nr:SagB/ThcOx family dehydrogenase [Candidatus Acidoferrum sp.]